METVKKSITTVVGGVAEMPLGDVAVLKQLALHGQGAWPNLIAGASK